MSSFFEEIEDFWESLGIEYRIVPGDGIVTYSFSPKQLSVIAVPLSFFDDRFHRAELISAPHTIHIFEDRWRSIGTVVRNRLRAHLGLQKSVFARNCEVRSISAETSASFLDKYHAYGNTKAKFRYGLFRTRATGVGEAPMSDSANLIAVATFSSPRTLQTTRDVPTSIEGVSFLDNRLLSNEILVNGALSESSCEWERYASLPEYRVVGGMGKLLNYFIECQHPTAVMSYADLEWSEGEVYSRLGFHKVGLRPPVEFLVDTATFSRISKEKLGRDRRFNETPASFIPIFNLGSVKYFR